MGELAVSRTSGHVLASIGLGSCIGLVLVERSRSLAGLAHIVLPESAGKDDVAAGKFADSAVPALLAELSSLGARRSRLEAVLVGGAQMFALKSSTSMDIGKRNEQAARAALEQLGVTVSAAATGGNLGRTVRVYVDGGRVTVKQPGAPEEELFAGAAQVGSLR
ncbi:MAG TPA: hypothetical protein VMD79_08565 [Solirubrobacteraceae bacterium]|nr:hypothetical protein [Solirubrobacteraceae bacterium]